MKVTSQDLVGVLFFLCWIFIILYVGAIRDLEECQKWKTKAYNELPPFKQRQLQEQAKSEQELLKEISNRPDPR